MLRTSVGCATKVTDVLPGGLTPEAEVMLEASLVYVVAGVAEVTLTLTVQDAIDALRLPVTAIVEPLAGAVTTPEGQVVVAAGVVTVRPAGNVSVNDQPLSAPSSLVLVIVNVSTDVCPTPRVVGANDLSNCGVTSRIWILSNA